MYCICSIPKELDPALYGISATAVHFLDGILHVGPDRLQTADLIALLDDLYCGPIAVEFLHLQVSLLQYFSPVFGRLVLWGRCPVCLSLCLSLCDVGVLWPNGWTDQDFGMRVGLGPSHIVLHGVPGRPPPTKGAQLPPTIFWPMTVVAKRLNGLRFHLV